MLQILNLRVGQLQFAAVPRRLLSLVLLLVFVCQSLAGVGSQAVADRAQEFDHSNLHWQDTDHHHHDDQSLHVEDAGGDSRHQHTDSGMNNPCLLTMGWDGMPSIRPVSPDLSVRALGAAPLLEGLLRPPEAAA